MESGDFGKILAFLSRKKEYLRRKYSIREIGVFGSYVRQEHSKGSDLDVLVDFEKPISLLRFVELEAELSEVTGFETPYRRIGSARDCLRMKRDHRDFVSRISIPFQRE
jgi:predicted nucleotidyltransferase